MPLLDADSCVSIRAALDASLDKADLPNEIILLDLYAGEAERWVTSQITITGAEATGSRAKLAAVYMAAALLAQAVAQVVSQKDATGETVSLKTYDPVKKEAAMRARAAEMIALVNDEPDANQVRPTQAVRQMSSCITVICPTHRVLRSRCGCSGAVLVF